MADTSTGRNDRGRIVDVALGILDAHGLADLTMRRLAAELDVRASALYWHFENKQTLLAAIADRIVGSAAAAPDADPAEVALALRAALLAHRDGAEVVISTQALALGADHAGERLRDALSLELGPSGAARTAAALLQFTLGHASLVQQRLQAVRLGLLPLSPDEVEHAAREDFDAGVGLILAGAARETR